MLLRVLVALVALVATAAAQPRKPKPPPTPAPIDPRLLPVWSGNVEGGAVQVHALDVDGEALRAALAPRGQWVALPTARRVSGRIAVRKRAAALAALVALVPELATASRPLRGGGTKVDLDFRAASTTDLYRLFADVMRTNIVVLAPDSQLTVRVKRVGVNAVLAEVARMSGAVLDRPAPNLIVVRPATEPRVGFIPSSGAKLSLDADQIHAGILVALIRALDPVPLAVALRDASLVCNGGKPITVRLKKVAGSVALHIAALAGGADLRGPRCALPPLPAGTDVRTIRLAAVVERGTQRMAAVEVDGKGAFLLDGKDAAWRIGTSWIEHTDQDVTFQLHDDRGPRPDDRSAPTAAPALRLAATVIDGRERVAIVELRGTPHFWTQGHPVYLDASRVVDITIEPGRVTLHDDGEVLHLTPR